MNIFKKMWKKKGVSPLIATVLLIAFAVSLGAVVMNWGRGYVETTAKNTEIKVDIELSCQMDIDIGVKKIGKIEKLCYNGTARTIEVMLENTGREDVSGIRIISIDVDDKINQHDNLTFLIGAGSVSQLYVHNYNDSVSLSDQLQFVEIVPMIKIKGKTAPQSCLSNSIKFDELSLCT